MIALELEALCRRYLSQRVAWRLGSLSLERIRRKRLRLRRRLGPEIQDRGGLTVEHAGTRWAFAPRKAGRGFHLFRIGSEPLPSLVEGSGWSVVGRMGQAGSNGSANGHSGPSSLPAPHSPLSTQVVGWHGWWLDSGPRVLRRHAGGGYSQVWNTRRGTPRLNPFCWGHGPTAGALALAHMILSDVAGVVTSELVVAFCGHFEQLVAGGTDCWELTRADVSAWLEGWALRPVVIPELPSGKEV